MKLQNYVINKNFVLKHISQIKIFATYTGLTENEIITLAETGSLICSPLREDSNPTFGFKFKDGRLRARDFAGYFWGDCFDVAAHVLSKSVNNKHQFIEILQDILNTVQSNNNIHHKLETVKKKRDVIEIAIRNWNVQDYHYWNKFNIDQEILTKFYVYPIQVIWINRVSQPEPKYRYNKIDPCYAYYFGKDDNSTDKFQLYFPYRDKQDKTHPRFIINYSGLRGVLQLTYDEDVLVITKSYKDVMSISSIKPSFLKGWKLAAISPNGESDIFTIEQINWFKSKYKYIISLYDFDKAGRKGALRLYNDYGIEPMFFTNGKFKTIDYGVKDFSEAVDKYGVWMVIDLINNIIENKKGQI